ncbi:hypothetical protein A3C32_04090 [Candidatus Daviesbacteria bacterium RIFCSPHIGHO2_02_FULL_41_14]|nr:MAG: hypothetical protein A3C32_04090 [Candidatus Daviesbacteria bacterium RIFCSPHIGHO2_02_FULL_41_14]
MDKIKQLLKNQTARIILGGLLLLIIAGYFAYTQILASRTPQELTEMDLNFDLEGPYAVLVPRQDGNAMVLNLRRTSGYDGITYELAYNSEGIDRGVVGEISTKEKKGEYTQEILFGTCSRNVCKYDKDVENGTLTLRIKKGGTIYKMITQWHLQKPDVALGKLISGDNHFIYQSVGKPAQYALVGFSIINDLSAAPKLSADKEIVGKVYSLSTPSAKDLPEGNITIELSGSPSVESRVSKYSESEGKWVELDTKTEGSKLTAKASGGGIFTVLSAKR